MFNATQILDKALAVLPGQQAGLLAASLALAFAAVFVAVLGGARVLRPDPLRRRMAGSLPPRDSAAPARLRTGEGASKASSLWRRIEVLRVVWAAGLPLLFGASLLATETSLSWVEGGIFGVALAALGALVPGRWLAWQEARRREVLRLGFPDALDMMVVCVEAGLGLDAALARVAREIGRSHPPIAAELNRVVRELRAGKPRDAVLRDFARRTGLPELASFATLLIQAETLGTGIARTLRGQAEDMRAARMLRAEERAHTLPVKLTIPLVVCVLPAMIAVVLLPGVVTLVRDILPNLGR